MGEASRFWRGRAGRDVVTRALPVLLRVMSRISITVNGDAHDFATDQGEATVSQLLTHLELADTRVAVEVNGDIVPRDRHQAHVLRDGDRIEIVTFVGGG